MHEHIYKSFLPHLVDLVDRIVVGLPEADGTHMGPVVSKEHYDKVLGFIDIARAEGAAVLSGGSRPNGPEFASGYWIRPTVFGDVQQTMRIAREEVFGPVLSVLKWEDEDQLVADVNSTEHGLTANIWTRDLDVALRIIPRLHAGYCYVNGSTQHFLGLPFGGYKESGIGREESLSELLSYSQVKSVSVLPSA